MDNLKRNNMEQSNKEYQPVIGDEIKYNDCGKERYGVIMAISGDDVWLKIMYEPDGYYMTSIKSNNIIRPIAKTMEEELLELLPDAWYRDGKESQIKRILEIISSHNKPVEVTDWDILRYWQEETGGNDYMLAVTNTVRHFLNKNNPPQGN